MPVCRMPYAACHIVFFFFFFFSFKRRSDTELIIATRSHASSVGLAVIEKEYGEPSFDEVPCGESRRASHSAACTYRPAPT